MEWKNLNFDWNRAKAFLVAAEEGSYSKAAQELKVNVSTLGRQVAALEEELGVALFERVGKGMEVTPAGLDLIEHVKVMGEAANSFAMAASGKSSKLEGVVTITASEAYSVYLLPEIVKKLRKKEPGIRVEIKANNAGTDLRRREADIAIRNYTPKHPDLIARKVKDSIGYLYGSDEYIKEKGPFKKKEQLQKADMIGFGDSTVYMDGLNQFDLNLTEENFVYLSENHITHWSLVKSGAGIGVMSEVVAKKYPHLKKILAKQIKFPVETWIVSHRELKTSRKIRYVYDFLVEEFNNL